MNGRGRTVKQSRQHVATSWMAKGKDKAAGKGKDAKQLKGEKGDSKKDASSSKKEREAKVRRCNILLGSCMRHSG